MRSNNVLGFIFAATLDDKIPELASSRTTASVPIGGKYRIIDFDLSNMSKLRYQQCRHSCKKQLSVTYGSCGFGQCI